MQFPPIWVKFIKIDILPFNENFRYLFKFIDIFYKYLAPPQQPRCLVPECCWTARAGPVEMAGVRWRTGAARPVRLEVGLIPPPGPVIWYLGPCLLSARCLEADCDSGICIPARPIRWNITTWNWTNKKKISREMEQYNQIHPRELVLKKKDNPLGAGLIWWGHWLD